MNLLLPKVHSLLLYQPVEDSAILCCIERMALLQAQERDVVPGMENDWEDLLRSLDKVAGAPVVVSACVVPEQIGFDVHEYLSDNGVKKVANDTRNPLLKPMSFLRDANRSI